ncbi:MAG: hypothetical protein EBY66_04160 [Candidatus Fonsibacter lacus]|nr:hypothetical protein [Candidatus Fonsibacter lacus]
MVRLFSKSNKQISKFRYSQMFKRTTATNKVLGLKKREFANGSVIEFFSADDSSKLRGARRDILYINECNNVTFDAYNELAIRTRKEVYLDFNPANEFWVHTELKDEPDSDFLILTYKDNEALDKSIVEQIEKNRDKANTSSYWANWWKVYGEGQLGMLEGVVFSNWKAIDTIPKEARLLGIGLDFGYTNDPTAIVEIYSYNGQRIVNQIVYQNGLVNSEIAKRLPKNVIVYADSSEPKSIEEIRRLGITIKGVTKGKDSINYGIDVMQRQDYLVTNQSVDLIKELRSYIWDTDKQGKRLNKPINFNNHAIDAFRYHEMETLGIGSKRINSLLDMKLDITVPSSISEIPLVNYQKFLKLQESSNDQEFIAQKMIEIFCGIELKDIVKIKLSSINELIQHFTKIFDEKPKFKPTFKIGDIEFGFIPDLENITFGEYVDLDNYLSKWDTFHKAMAVMYRPITLKKDEKYNIMEYTGASEFSDLMLYAPMDVAISASLFFWTLGNELLSATLNYLESELTKMNKTEQATLAHELSLEKNGGGIAQSMDSLRETLQNMTRLQNTDYLNVLPILPLKQKKTK